MQTGSTERTVYKVLAAGLARCEETALIARLCSVTELQVIVAMRCLERKKMLPVRQVDRIV